MSKVALIAVSALFLSVTAANASVVFTDRTAFNTAVSPNGAEDFDTFAANVPFDASSPVVAGIFTFSSNFTGVGNSLIGPSAAINGVGGVQAEITRPDNLGIEVRIDFATALSAWGAEFIGFGGSSQQSTISFFDASDTLISSFVAGAEIPTLSGFRGFDLASAASYILFSAPSSQSALNDAFFMDDFTYRTADNVIPLPGALPLFIAGLGGFGLIGRKRRKATA